MSWRPSFDAACLARAVLIASFGALVASGCGGSSTPPPSSPGLESLPGAPPLFEEDFATAEGGWLEQDSDAATYEFRDGGYRILVKRPYSVESAAEAIDPAVVGLSVEVAASDRHPTLAGHSYGLECSTEGREYVFKIDPGRSRYAIVTDDFGGVERTLAEGATGPVLRAGSASNVLEVRCLGSAAQQTTTLILRLNGKQLAVAKDKRGVERFEDVGVVAETGETLGADVLFDNFVVREASG